MAPEGWLGPALEPQRARVDGTLMKGPCSRPPLAGDAGQRCLQAGAYSSIEELARAERINASYLARLLRLTLLAPDIVNAILDGKNYPQTITLDRLLKPFPATWDDQLQGI